MPFLKVGWVAALVLLLPKPVDAQQLAALPPAGHPSSSMMLFGAAEPPPGFVHFCEEEPSECAASSNAEKPMALSSARLRELDEINRWVNQSVEAETDIAHYGVKEYWTIPIDGKGDCEDFALLKRHLLMQRGWPSSALLMTVVVDENGQGHAVLTVRTRAGDLILDNKVNEIRKWNATRYEFVMRQSSRNPRVWVYLEPAVQIAPAPTAVARQPR
jgi:predicted transglutaminase-like cysteine proteinase